MSDNHHNDSVSSTTNVEKLPSDEVIGELETVAYFNGPMPTGVTVSHQGRIFINFPKWGDDVPFTVAEIVDGRAVAYPDKSINKPIAMSLPMHLYRCNQL